MKPTSAMRLVHEVRRARRGAGLSLYHTYGSPSLRNPRFLLDKAVWQWLIHYATVMFTPRQHFPVYPASPAGLPGVFAMPDPCRVALAGDWGSGTPSAYRVMQRIREQAPDITVHLGDIYYSGTVEEVEQYFLGDDDWYRGPHGTYALNANHEMYSGGAGYFERVLPALNQQTSYFCLANTHWRLVAVDTGYYAKFFPLLELLASSTLLKLHEANLRWLQEVVFADAGDRRPVILLSHHQWFSAFEDEYTRLGQQLRPYLDRLTLWFWGHEHRFAAYGAFGLGGAPQVRARCIGHGGMPVELGEQPKRQRHLVCYDTRANPENAIGNEPIGYCGYALLGFNANTLTVQYYDEDGELLLEERWVSDPATHQTTGSITHDAHKLHLVDGASIEGLVQ